MRKAMSITLVLVLALAAPAFARMVDKAGTLDKVHSMDVSGQTNDFVGASDPGVFGAAQAGTTWFGGTVWAADSARWEAIQGQLWTFETGVGSSIVGQSTVPGVNPYKLAGLHNQLEGWIGWDNSYSEITYFRRLSDTDARWSTVCVGSGAGLGGDWSFWAGVFNGEADALCYSAGQGYGSGWNLCIERGFTYTGGGVTLGYKYKLESEPDFDYAYVYVDTTGLGDNVEAASYTGAVSGTESLSLTQSIELPVVVPASIKIKFCFSSDGAWDDQDGANPTDCGAFAVDDITVSGGGITHTATFETTNDGWTLSPPAPGLGGDWSDIVHLSDLPETLTPCDCALSDSVMVFQDDSGAHNDDQDGLAASPWIDLKAAGLVGSPGKILKTNLYVELPLLNYIFVQFNAQWYPEVCNNTGRVYTSAWTSDGFVRYFGGVPGCTAPATVIGTELGTQIDFSGFIPSGAEQVRMALGVISYCGIFGNCTGVSNTTPWFDYVGFGVYGTPGAPFIFVSSVDLPQDNFPENGTLNLNAPGRVECNNIQPTWPPEPGTTMGDTIVVSGGVGDAEVYVHFRVVPGPGTNATAFSAWWNKHANSTYAPDGVGFKMARIDTAERNGFPSVGDWMTCYHEDDPNFTGTDTDRDLNDVSPIGGLWRLKNDIFPDDLFTGGTRIDMFWTANNVGSAESYKTPVGDGLFSEMEILPSSMTAGGQFNCVLYVDHFNRGAQVYIEDALTSVLGTGSENFEGTNWDRFDVNAESSQQGSFGRPLQSDYCATVIQTLGYQAIVYSSGNLDAFNLVKEDADVLNPWLTLLNFDFNNLYLTGDGVVNSAIEESESEPSARRLVEDLAGVTKAVGCAAGNFSAQGCPVGAPEDLTPCVNIDPVVGAPIAGSGAGRSVDHLAQGNGCPTRRIFDVLATVEPDFGTSAGDERYVGGLKNADYVSVVTDASDEIGAVLNYKIVTDGVSVHYRRDEGTPCDFNLGGDTSVTERIREVLSYFGYNTPQLCVDRTAGTGLVDNNQGRQPKFRTSLADFAPNPLVTGAAGRIQFTMSREGRASIEVYDIEGRLVKSVFSGIAQEGVNEAFWNGTDEAGTQVASGVYFYRLRSADEDLSKKMVVVRNGGN